MHVRLPHLVCGTPCHLVMRAPELAAAHAALVLQLSTLTSSHSELVSQHREAMSHAERSAIETKEAHETELHALRTALREAKTRGEARMHRQVRSNINPMGACFFHHVF